MNCSKLIAFFTLPAALVTLVVVTQIAKAEKHEYVSKAKVTPLVQEKLEGVQDREITIKRFEIEPGFVGGRHSHTGPVYVYVANGELTVDVDGVGRSVVKAGEIYKEPIGRPMQGRNASTTSSLTLIVFQVGEPGKPMMIKEN